MRSFELGIREAPDSTTIFTQKYASTVRVGQVDHSLIEDVVPNKAAKDFLPADFAYLTSADHLITNVFLSIPQNNSDVDSKVLLTNGSWGRAITTHYGHVPIADSLAGIESQKGIGPSARILADEQNNFTDQAYDPWGFFGEIDARKEMKWSNLLAAHGFRTSIALGYVIFKHDKLASYLLGMWKKHARIHTIIDRALAIVKENGDKPVSLFRLGGVSERFVTYGQTGSYFGESDQLFNNPDRIKHEENRATNRREVRRKRRRAEMARVMQLWLTEALYHPSNFKRYLPKSTKVEDFAQAADELLSLTVVSPKTFDMYLHICAGIIATNALAIDSLPPNTISNEPGISNLQNMKDLDLSFIYTDYENVPENASIGRKTETSPGEFYIDLITDQLLKTFENNLPFRSRKSPYNCLKDKEKVTDLKLRVLAASHRNMRSGS